MVSRGLMSMVQKNLGQTKTNNVNNIGSSVYSPTTNQNQVMMATTKNDSADFKHQTSQFMQSHGGSTTLDEMQETAP